ncbi:MAG: APA family basic amino acid/polyamine antiporter [Maribacter sp.]|jgi:hypothetical protein
MGSVSLLLFLAVHTYKDFTSKVKEWYFHSTPIWIIVMDMGSLLFFIKWKQLKRKGINPVAIFKVLPEE